MKKFLFAIILSTAAISCTTTLSESIFLTTTSDISLSWKEDVQIRYDAERFQMGFNSSRNEYRVYDDRLSDWFTLRCSEKPSTEGQTLTADVSWTGSNSTKNFKGLQFNVIKADETGLIWLWNTTERLGIVVRNI